MLTKSESQMRKVCVSGRGTASPPTDPVLKLSLHFDLKHTVHVQLYESILYYEV